MSSRKSTSESSGLERSFNVNKQEPKYELMRIIKLNLDLFFGIIMTYTVTLECLCYFVPYFYYLFDSKAGHENTYLIQIFILSFNIGDTIGKLIPETLFFDKKKFLFICNLIRVAIIQIYFYYIIEKQTKADIAGHISTRIIMFFLIGITNGFFTNNFFCLSSRRFNNPSNTDKTGSVILLGLIIGVVLGTLIGYVYILFPKN
jgi:hypothetical protein